jgi:hypothetical protein
MIQVAVFEDMSLNPYQRTGKTASGEYRQPVRGSMPNIAAYSLKLQMTKVMSVANR